MIPWLQWVRYGTLGTVGTPGTSSHRLPKYSALSVSETFVDDGEQLQKTVVREFPPSESCRNRCVRRPRNRPRPIARKTQPSPLQHASESDPSAGAGAAPRHALVVALHFALPLSCAAAESRAHAVGRALSVVRPVCAFPRCNAATSRRRQVSGARTHSWPPALGRSRHQGRRVLRGASLRACCDVAAC